MQEDITIKLNSKTKAYGILLEPKTSTNRLIIFVHGFLSNQEHHLFYNAAHYFHRNNYSTFRYNLYGYQDNARKANVTSFRTFAQDLSKIVSKFKRQYSKIILVSHSLGAYIVLLVNPSDISSLVLWEPSLHPKEMFKNAKKDGDYYIFDLGFQIRIHLKTIASMVSIPNVKILLNKIHKPVAIISGEKAGKKIGEYYYTLANKPKKIDVIEGAGHNFDEVGTESQLFKLTLAWLEDRKQPE
jgi:pimeloyl-ACP methyl ester carboxylesterase